LTDLINKFLDKNFDQKREQVETSGFVEDLMNGTKFKGVMVVITDKDIYNKNNNFCFGTSYSGTDENEYVVISTNRVKEKSHLAFILIHELGHSYGAAKKGREHTDESLGIHCTNDGCVMQQKIDMREALSYAEKVYKKKIFFCNECKKDIENYKNNNL